MKINSVVPANEREVSEKQKEWAQQAVSPDEIVGKKHS
jgi:hypothetical protein